MGEWLAVIATIFASCCSQPHYSFVGPPEVRVQGQQVTVAARVNRALPQGRTGVLAEISASGTAGDIPGLQALAGVRRCYAELRFGALHPGQLVEARLDIRGRHPQTLIERVRVKQGNGHGLTRSLGCLRSPERRCDGLATGTNIATTAAGGGATCSTARRVMRAVGTWISTRCIYDLCAHRHRMNLGYRCTIAKVGEADWAITCRRGRRVVRGYVAD